MNYFAVLELLQNKSVEYYYKTRYGYNWYWYYLNWEQNGEFLL